MIEAAVEEVIVMGTVADCGETVVHCTEPSLRCQRRDGDTLAGTLPVVTPTTPTTQQQHRGQHQTGAALLSEGD